MSTSRVSRRVAALTLAGVSIFGLAGCTGAPPAIEQPSRTATPSAPSDDDATGDGGQSTAEACRLVEDTIEQASAEFENVSNEDPTAVIEAMRSAAQKLADASTQVTNDEVAALLPSLQKMFTDVAEVMTALAEGDASRIAEIEELGTSLQETSAKFQELCAPAS
jgi:hypothetical protein